MNARVFLIVVLTGLFMAAWNSDQAAEQQFLVQRAEQRAAMAVAQFSDRSSAVSTDAIPVSIPDTHAEPQEQPGDSHFRPDGMAAGSYRAVNERGVTFEFTVDEAGDAASRDFYIDDDSDGIRWYFVRVQSGD